MVRSDEFSWAAVGSASLSAIPAVFAERETAKATL